VPARLLVLLVLATLSACFVPAAAGAAPSAHRSPSPIVLPRVAFGAFVAGYPGSGSQLSQFQSAVGTHIAIASSFDNWGDIFPDSSQLADSDSGHTLLIAWNMGSTAATRFATFPRHKHDVYLAREAAAIARYGKPIYIRPWAEMNGDWTAFQPTPSGDKPAGGTYAQFIAAWRYLVRFFRSHGATNARWVFNPTTDTYPGTTPIKAIWPGARYVNVLGLDGYNWGTGGWFTWRSFANIYATQYARITALSPTLPVWICETGSKEPSENDGAPVDPRHSKATWYRSMFAWLARTGTRVTVVSLFETYKERDWRIASNPGAWQVFQTAAARAPRLEARSGFVRL
jgi:hypothetical protein